MDATEGVLRIFHSLNRSDVNLIMLNGCVVAWFNIIDLTRVYKELSLPLICVTYEESEGLEKYLREYFPADWKERLDIFNKNCGRTEALLRTKQRVFVREFGLDHEDAVRIVDQFTLQGGIPEPLRLARLLAGAIRKSTQKGMIPSVL